MAYSMFERPKLHNAKSMKLNAEEYDHHVSFRHKNLRPDFDLTVENLTGKYKQKDDSKNYSIQAQTSTYKKCPIYIHSFGKIIHQNEGDFILKTNKKPKNKKSVIEKLEETYWANWRPDKTDQKKAKFPELKSVKSPEIQVIKGAPERRRKIKVFPHPSEDMAKCESDNKLQTNSQEIQTDDVSITPKSLDKENEQENSFEEIDTKFLKHTDSLILTIRKNKEGREHFEQPRCIRLYRKPGKFQKTSKNLVKGGSYPLKSCLKKDSNFAKGNIRLGRPGSPIIVSSNYSSKYGKAHRR